MNVDLVLREPIDGKTLIELGAGVGVPGMAAHILGAKTVITEQETTVPDQ